MGRWRAFWHFVANVHSIEAWMTKAAAAAPLADLVINAGPPWPDHTFVIAGTVLVEMLVYMIAFTFLAGRSRALLALIVSGGAIAVAMIGVLYLFLFAAFIKPAPDYRDTVVVGYELRPDVVGVYKDKAKLPSKGTLLARAGYEEEAVWTERSLTCMRIIVLVVWLALFVAVSLVFCAFALLHDPGPPPPAPGAPVAVSH